MKLIFKINKELGYVKWVLRPNLDSNSKFVLVQIPFFFFFGFVLVKIYNK